MDLETLYGSKKKRTRTKTKKIEIEKTGRDKLIIIGTAPSMERIAWDNDAYDYWACSPLLSYDIAKGKRIDAVFEMHNKSHWNAKNILDMFKSFLAVNPDSKIYMQEKYKEIKNSEKYPLEEIQRIVNNDLFGQYMTSSIAYMVSMAVTLGKYKKIELWGCHMGAEEEEYSRQRSAVEAWLTYGAGKGIDFWLTPEAELFKHSGLYGYEQNKDMSLKILSIKSDVATGEEHYKNVLDKATSNYHEQKGGRIMMEKLIRELKIKQ